MNTWSQRGFSHGAENSSTCYVDQGEASSKEYEICNIEDIPKGSGGESSELQEQCQQVICQIDTMAATPSPAQHLTTKQGVKEGEAKSLVVTNPVTPHS